MNDVKFGMNQYCGPAVLSILTGKNTDECAAVIGAVTNTHAVKGVTVPDLIKAAKKLRFELREVTVYGNSLFAAVSQLVGQGDAIYLVMVPKHFVAVEIKDKQVYFCDNHTKEPIKAEAAARLGQKVLGVYRAFAMPEKQLLETQVNVRKQNYSSGISLTITSHELYVNPEDNVTKNLGYLTVKDTAELAEIVNQIWKVI